MERAYRRGAVLALIESDLVTPPTRRALKARLKRPSPASPAFFDDAAYATMCSTCARLIPQPEPILDLAAALDARLAAGAGDGWRYAALPPDAELHALGARGIEESARERHGRGFAELNGDEQDAVLGLIEAGVPPGPVWARIDAARYFEELLALLVDIFYAHPLAQDEIGYAGMADARGWTAIGLNEREDHEPAERGGA